MKIKKIINCLDFYCLITNHKNPLVYFCESKKSRRNGQIETIIDDNQIKEWLLLSDLKTLKKILK